MISGLGVRSTREFHGGRANEPAGRSCPASSSVPSSADRRPSAPRRPPLSTGFPPGGLRSVRGPRVPRAGNVVRSAVAPNRGRDAASVSRDELRSADPPVRCHLRQYRASSSPSRARPRRRSRCLPCSLALEPAARRRPRRSAHHPLRLHRRRDQRRDRRVREVADRLHGAAWCLVIVAIYLAGAASRPLREALPDRNISACSATASGRTSATVSASPSAC